MQVVITPLLGIETIREHVMGMLLGAEPLFGWRWRRSWGSRSTWHVFYMACVEPILQRVDDVAGTRERHFGARVARKK